jgi:hypothetical protein
LGERGEGSLEGFWDCFLVERPNLEGDEILDLKEIIMNNGGWTMDGIVNKKLHRTSKEKRM